MHNTEMKSWWRCVWASTQNMKRVTGDESEVSTEPAFRNWNLYDFTQSLSRDNLAVGVLSSHYYIITLGLSIHGNMVSNQNQAQLLALL